VETSQRVISKIAETVGRIITIQEDIEKENKFAIERDLANVTDVDTLSPVFRGGF